SNDSRVVQEEIFGPVLTVQPFDWSRRGRARPGQVTVASMTSVIPESRQSALPGAPPAPPPWIT
ncbi:hypothetical protein, partial [Streptomyces sp. NPDC005485]|uniref:hypothetical protein n=1 Tax=Streptomyces sp. NPDC005485 TaxID=3155591 RepID=UPI0033B1A2B6